MGRLRKPKFHFKLRKPKIKLKGGSSWIFIGLIAGLFTGLFFGEMVGWMQWLGSAVIFLLQATVLPYMVMSLLYGVGSLTTGHAKLLFSKTSIVLVLLWVLGLLVILLLPLSFPEQLNASFFSASVLEVPPSPDYMKLYIPSNPFHSLAEGYVPAVVIFCMLFGVALIRIQNKQAFMSLTETSVTALSKMTGMIVKILPIGVFASTAAAAGTMTLEEFSSLQVFLISYMVLCLFLTFVLLPFTLSALTPFTYREVMTISRDSLITAFATGNILILLPVLTEQCKNIFHARGLATEETDKLIGVTMPVAFTFPNLGKLTVILFVLFAAWFVDKEPPFSLATMTSISGLFTLFGSVQVAVPFMLNLLEVPADLYQLFLISNVITSRFNSMVAALNLVVLVLITITMVQNQLRITLMRGLFYLGILAGGFVATLLLNRLITAPFVEDQYTQSSLVAEMKMVGQVPEKVYAELPKLYETGRFSKTTVAQIKQRNILRVGFHPKNVPFSYFNANGELVGFDISLAHQLASDLGVEIRFVPLDYNKLPIELGRGFYDIAMSGLAMTAERIADMSFTDPVLQLHVAVVGRDHELSVLSDPELLKKQTKLVIATLDHSDIVKHINRAYPNAEVVMLKDYEQFFEAKEGTYDALLVSAEAGYAWTVLYPEFGVWIPTNAKKRVPVAYALNRSNNDLLSYLDDWLDIQQSNDFIGQQYEFWILGGGAKHRPPRWSVIKDLLGWVGDKSEPDE
ncbi:MULTISPECIES: cation:dicarboxylate symporter family transporter [Corallincola]|uniref:Cation:dicarboxylase symporter family transporter n=2 Tax=Corallincola TaxID=1775176 RepID=A0ABY1WSQ5_9GAMM|nr:MULTISPECIES: cation:dicarboxylase symporter family transporter [Corallincola]TAA47771.1 cation:dicarboxylase symporter family transporter [Corallincola spongiicola]TCI01498.1 cation:dicarboxylase symporter family transporter [Corallincola luteus]